MTFANSSSDKKNLNSMSQWAITMRRKWLLAVYILSAIIWYPITTVVRLTGDLNRLGSLYPELSLKSVLIHDFSRVVGFDSFSFLAVTVLAFITAIQGFAYLYRRQTIDFYESQPITRNAMFAKIYINGFLMFLCTHAVGYILAFLVAGAMGVFRLALVAEALVELAELSLLFLGIYSITALGTIVSGTLIMGIMVSLFLLAAEVVIRGLVLFCSQTYLATFYFASFDVWNTVTSPFFIFIETADRFAINYTDDSVYRIASVYRHLENAVGPDIKILVIAIVATVLAWVAYKYRKSESAGHSVVFRQAEWILKLVCGVAACILTGVVMDGVTQGAVAIVFIGMILTAAIICAVAEIIFESDFKALFKNSWHIAVVSILGIVVILGYRFDVTGFETYIPAAEKVSSCAIFDTYGMGRNYYEADGTAMDTIEYFEKYMYLSDIEGVEDIARYGQQVKVDRDRMYRGLDIARYEDTMQDPMEMDYSWNRVIMYRMKNGKTVYRSILIPESTDPAMLDRVTKSPEYSLCMYNIDDGFIETAKAAGEYSELNFDSGCSQFKGDGELFGAFIEAFRQDIEENYCFTLANRSDPVGAVYYSPDNTVASDMNSYYLSFPIFPEYKRTIKFLSDNGLYTEGILPEDQIASITVYYDANVNRYYSDETKYEYEEVREKEYTDPASISAMMSVAHCDGNDWEWRSANYFDYSYEVVVKMDSSYKPEGYGNRVASYSLYFRNDKIPDFVKTDLKAK